VRPLLSSNVINKTDAIFGFEHKLMVIGLIIIILSFGLSRIYEDYSVWIMAIGFPIGAFLIIKGRQKLGSKNKFFINE
jgi:hypothetical protein